MDIRQFTKGKSIIDSRRVENISGTRLRIEVQPSQSSGVERIRRLVDVHLHGIVSNLKRISKISTLPLLEKFMRTPMHSQSHPRTHSLTHALTVSPMHSQSHPCTHSLTHALTVSPMHSQSHTYNGFFRLVEALLHIHSCFFSHSIILRGLPLSAVAVSLHYQ